MSTVVFAPIFPLELKLHLVVGYRSMLPVVTTEEKGRIGDNEVVCCSQIKDSNITVSTAGSKQVGLWVRL